ncbi:MAG: family 10 glycosylhydrolase, partial [Paraclostridium sp.]
NMNAAWITTVYNKDWPKNKYNPEEQKREMRNLLDELKETGIDTVMFQARAKGDALYSSNINPWSDILTGTQGKYPGYDPLAYVIEQAKIRNMKVHVWLNPYRVTTSGTDPNKLSDNHPAKKNPSWVLSHDGRLYYNPELAEVKQHIIDTVSEIVKNYDIDGIHFDDYFYPANYPLPEGEGKDGVVANSRRDHITEMVSRVNTTVKNIKPHVEFGVSPRGIWKNKGSDPNGSDTRGAESYYADYADTIKWVQNNYIDYIVPQVYWEFGLNAADYPKVVSWWAEKLKNSNVDLYIGQGIYKDVVAKEIDKQLEFNKNYDSIKGSVFYTTSDIIENRMGCRDKIKNFIKSDNIKFTDIDKHWAKSSIIEFVEKGYIKGYGDGTFRPEASISRAEFVRVVNQKFGFTDVGNEFFNDVNEGDWYYNDVCIAVQKGYIKGRSATEFAPNEPITREEVAKIVSTIMDKLDSDIDKIYTFNDANEVSNWAIESVEGAIEAGYLSGYTEDNTIRPKNKITRAEAVSLLHRIK